jgi:hypothetical protein
MITIIIIIIIRSFPAFHIDPSLDLKRMAEFILFLKRIDPNLIRKFLTYPEQINSCHAFYANRAVHNTPYVDALDVIARTREAGCCNSKGLNSCSSLMATAPLSSSCVDRADAVLCTAFHQFFGTQKYIDILGFKKAADESIINAAKFARDEAKADTAKATAEISVLNEAAAEAAVAAEAADSSSSYTTTTTMMIDTAAAAAVSDAKRRRKDALAAKTVATTTIHLYENYISNYLAHDIGRTRDEIHHRDHDAYHHHHHHNSDQ